MVRHLIVALSLLTAPAGAQETPVDGEGWRAYTEGWTLYFEEDGAPFGAESYLPGGEVIWKPEGGECAHGYWAETQGRICFLYREGVACWRIFKDAAGLLARPAEGPGSALRVARRDRAPLWCPETPTV